MLTDDIPASCNLLLLGDEFHDETSNGNLLDVLSLSKIISSSLKDREWAD
jgi:hypothetical protein